MRGGASDLLVVRKKGIVTTATRRLTRCRDALQMLRRPCVCVCVCASGEEFERMTMTKAVSGVFRIQVFPSGRTSLSDAHRFCQDGCSRDACCDGFVLNRNSLSGGALPWRRTSAERQDNQPPPPPLRFSAVRLAESSVSLDVRGQGLGHDRTGDSQSRLWGGACLQRETEQLRV